MIDKNIYALLYKDLPSFQLVNSLHDACENGQFEHVQYLLTSKELKQNPSIHSADDLPLRLSCQKGHIEIVKYLLTSSELKDHANINADNGDPLITACENGHFEIVKYLLSSSELKQHADIYAYNCHAFKMALHNNHMEIVDYLLHSLDLKKHIDIHYDKDAFFRSVASSNQDNKIKLAHYLIFDLNIEKTEYIEATLKKPFAHELQKMFEVRDLKNDLNNNLEAADDDKVKRIKI